MVKDIYKAFEFDIIKENLEKYVKGEVALRQIRELEMFTSSEELKKELSYLEEMISYTLKYRSLVINPHNDIVYQLISLTKDGVGSIEFFYQISSLLENVDILKEESSKDDKYPLIMEMLSNLISIPSLKNQIDHIITRDLQISDNASSELRSIRRNLRNEEQGQSKLINSLVLRYKDILNSEKYTMRNSSYVLPVKSSYKNSVSGIVVDESDSKLTVFIEPTEILESNNKIARLKEKEYEEIKRILKELSIYTLKYIEPLRSNIDIVNRLDFLLAKANYALDIKAEVANITNERVIYLKNARHPLIDKDKVVSNSFFLDKQKIMVISGPNAGGKTVCLKVIGLLVIMNQCGLALPTSEKANLCFFDKIFVDMGDNQSLMDNLSTFSGHIKNLKEILDEVTKDSLVILDELGTGTSPLEGEALGVGVITHLNNLGCFGIFTSHYEGLKSFALENEYILNASMAFDEENIVPTYHLRLGVAGKSYGIELSQRMGVEENVISLSKEYLENKVKSDKEVTLALLNQRLEENEFIKMELLRKEEELDKRNIELEREIEKYKRLENKIFLESEKEKEKLIQKAKEEIEEIMDEFKKSSSYKMHEVIASKKKLDDLSSIEEEEESISKVINVNDYVRIIDSDITGKVIRIKGDKISLISEQGMNLNVKLSQVERYFPKKKVKKVQTTSLFKTTKIVKLECNLIGLRVEEALLELDKYIDDAIVARYKEVRIVHGSGTGALREAVHNYLNRRKEIKSYRLGGLGEGGVGATVVYFK
ncbi:MAG: endonuclease MutS2 [Erysipelotrichaceae bacterium]|nr:endonuclease MutS2 [Erysipelotrichaceae bacterium]